MKDKIFSVIVPKEKQIEIKNGRRRTVETEDFPRLHYGRDDCD